MTQSSTGTRIGALWLDHPDDQLAHAWRDVLDGGHWRALCGLVADPTVLTVPKDDYGRHNDCVLQLGNALADRHDELRAEMRAEMRRDGM